MNTIFFEMHEQISGNWSDGLHLAILKYLSERYPSSLKTSRNKKSISVFAHSGRGSPALLMMSLGGIYVAFSLRQAAKWVFSVAHLKKKCLQ